MARTVALLAVPGPNTDLTNRIPLVDSSEWCSGPAARGRRWWIIDIEPHFDYFDTRGADYLTPDKGGVETYPARAPLYVALEYTASGPSEGWAHRRVIDAIPGRYQIFASTVNAYVLAPPGAKTFSLEQRRPSSIRDANTLVGAVFAGIAPAGDVDGLAPAEGGSIDASLTVQVNPTSQSLVTIPNGARTVQIFDSSASAWRWARPVTGLIPTTGGHSARVDVPGSCLALEAGDVATSRTVACVFGVHL